MEPTSSNKLNPVDLIRARDAWLKAATWYTSIQEDFRSKNCLRKAIALQLKLAEIYEEEAVKNAKNLS